MQVGRTVKLSKQIKSKYLIFEPDDSIVGGVVLQPRPGAGHPGTLGRGPGLGGQEAGLHPQVAATAQLLGLHQPCHGSPHQHYQH